jgi:hypothetical protein
VCALHFDGDHWTQDGRVEMPGSVSALSARDGNENMYAVTTTSAEATPTIVRIQANTMKITASERLTGAAQRVALDVLGNGDVAVAYGAGTVVLFNSDLLTKATHYSTSDNYINSMTDVPSMNALLVNADRRSEVLSADQLTPQTNLWRSYGPFSGAAISTDGMFLATANYLNFKLTIWSVSPPNMRQRVCHAVGRSLTQAEWSKYVGDAAPYDPVCPSH